MDACVGNHCVLGHSGLCPWSCDDDGGDGDDGGPLSDHGRVPVPWVEGLLTVW